VNPLLLIVGLGWLYVALMMAAAEATAPRGSLLGALLTFALYGVGPLALLLYLLDTPARRRRRRQREAEEPAASPAQPHGGGHAAGDAIAPEREEA
jgi:membrane protein implicated in regulation of membrane protease activity